jgi:hypothetical protein
MKATELIEKLAQHIRLYGDIDIPIWNWRRKELSNDYQIVRLDDMGDPNNLHGTFLIIGDKNESNRINSAASEIG